MSTDTQELNPQSALALAIERAGSQRQLAEAIGVTREAVTQWRVVPVLRVLAVERATGVPRHVLRPDIYPDD
jgi:DNA-binding transcriptional regulator YdaS (Cro superfamily)